MNIAKILRREFFIKRLWRLFLLFPFRMGEIWIFIMIITHLLKLLASIRYRGGDGEMDFVDILTGKKFSCKIFDIKLTLYSIFAYQFRVNWWHCFALNYQNLPLLSKMLMSVNVFQRSLSFLPLMCDASCDLVPFVQFNKREKHLWRVAVS